MNLNSLSGPHVFEEDKLIYDDNAPTLLETDGQWCKSLIRSLNNEIEAKRGRGNRGLKKKIMRREGKSGKNRVQPSSKASQIFSNINLAQFNDHQMHQNSQISSTRGRTEQPKRKQKAKKSKRVFTPRFVSDIIKLANEESSNNGPNSAARQKVGPFVPGRTWDFKMRKQVPLKKGNRYDLTAKISSYKPNPKLMLQPDRHIEALQRESLYGAAPDCYIPTVPRKCMPQNISKKGLIAPHGSPMIYKKSASAIHFGPSHYNSTKYERGRAVVPPFASKWLDKIKRIDMELRELNITQPQTQHFCCNLDMPLNPFLQRDYQARLRAERKRLKDEKEMIERYEYEERKREVEEHKYRVNTLPRIQREKREKQERERLEREMAREQERKARELQTQARLAQSTGNIAMDENGEPVQVQSFFSKKSKKKKKKKLAGSKSQDALTYDEIHEVTKKCY